MKLLKKPLIKFLLIPLMLLGVWVFGFLFLNPNESFTSITYTNFFLNKTSNNILVKDSIVSDSFVAQEDNLGTVLLEIDSIPKVDYDLQDILVFRIKEQGQGEWYSKNIYRSGGFLVDSQLFPFGFPIITDSKGKNYKFELESLSGNSNNAIQIGSKFSIRYTFDKKELTRSPDVFINFVIKKIYISLFDREFILASFVYLVPLLVYLLWLFLASGQITKLFGSVKQKKIAKSRSGKIFIENFVIEKKWMSLVVLIIILLYVTFMTKVNIGVSIVIIGSWIIMIILQIANSKMSFLFFCILLVFGLLGILFSQINFSTRISSWAYIFLFMGTIQSVFEHKDIK